MKRRERVSSPTVSPVGAIVLLGANLLPLVGVLFWEWSLWSLLVIYWAEAFSAVLVAALKVLFAERGSPSVTGQMEPLHELREKRGGWAIRGSWPPVYPRNIPFALSLVGGWSVTVFPLSIAYWLSVDAPPVLTLNLLFGLGTLVFAQGVDFVTEYIHREQYTDVSAREIMRTPAQLTALLLPLALFATGGGRTGGLVILVGVVLGKSAASLYRFYVEHIGRPVFGLGDWFETDENLSEPPPEIDLPDDDVQARVTVSAKSVLLGSIWAIAYGFANRLGLGALVVTGFAIIARNPVWIAIGLFGVGIIVSTRVLSYFFRYGTIEYQRRGNLLVAYDTLLEAPQWHVPVNSSTTFSVKNAIADRLLNTGTLTLSSEGGHEDMQLGPVADLDCVVDTLRLPVEETARPDRDPVVIGAASVLMLCFAAVPAGLFVSSQISDAMAGTITIVFAPFLLLPVGVLLWAALSRI
ncbi:DUF6498-containing protein [Haloarcula onubensis]|uniref:DUF6498-containing protein n=1 Tax=Haloarcula onubensis TaxID=2950539 RepID=A0ABU2FUS3_9EURY|nr:DUF6498-containing protein [Halomicroarcula sp. S3CR25-11]MDS0284517.1 DUF6498-containing protein [Halomicroarcula sp. S3CR25-11]